MKNWIKKLFQNSQPKQEEPLEILTTKKEEHQICRLVVDLEIKYDGFSNKLKTLDFDILPVVDNYEVFTPDAVARDRIKQLLGFYSGLLCSNSELWVSKDIEGISHLYRSSEVKEARFFEIEKWVTVTYTKNVKTGCIDKTSIEISKPYSRKQNEK